MNFEDAYAITSRMVPATCSYEYPDCQLLWQTAMSLPVGATIVEVGVEAGRSTSLLAQVALERECSLICIDPFLTYGGRAAQDFIKNMREINAPFVLNMMTTKKALWSGYLPDKIHMVHIDGDHYADVLASDCEILLPLVEPQCYAVFHDYGNPGLADVQPTVDKFTVGWKHIATQGTCHVVRKP
tara:strand:+ start:131 stop:685 length:555 start_codon:yes stop_codon:yes gene_type:complete